MKIGKKTATALLGILLATGVATPAKAATGDSRDVIWQGLLGAGVGAISAEASGGKAGKGALIGAGTNVLGSAILGFLTAPSAQPQTAAPVYYAQPAPVYAPAYDTAPTYYATPVSYQAPATYAAPASYATPVSYASSQADSSKQILKTGLLGAGVGAISAGASGGKAGTGALIGAGTNVIGGALVDTLFSSPTQARYTASPAPASYYYAQPSYGSSSNGSSTLKKRIVRKFDANGTLLSEEEYWE